MGKSDRVVCSALLCVFFWTATPAYAQNQKDLFDWRKPTEISIYIKDKLHEKNPARFLLALRMIKRLSRGAGVAEGSFSTQDPNVRAAILNRFSPKSVDKMVRYVHSLGRTQYNNAIAVGRAGVGKTFILDQLVLLLSLGIIPEMLEKPLGIGTESPFLDLIREAFIGKVQFVLVNDALLQKDPTDKGDAWANSEMRVKAVLHELFEAAALDFSKHKIRTVFVLEEARNLAPEVQPTLKALLDDSGFKDADSLFDSGGETGASVLQLTTTEELALMFSVEGAEAIARRYAIIPIMEPSEEDALKILQVELPRLEKRYGLKLQSGILQYIIENRRFFSNPPEAMPGSVLKALENLFIWCADAQNRTLPGSLEISFQDALAFKIHANQLPPSVWMPKDGKIPLASLEDEVVGEFAGSEGIVRRFVGKTKALFRNGVRDFPFFVVLGPPGSGKDTLARLTNQKMFGHNGRHLMFDFSNKDSNFLRDVLDGPRDGSLPLLVQRQGLGSPNGLIPFNEAKGAKFLDGLKIFAETDTLYPTGKDSRQRPMQLNGLVLMGQWGEELFANVDESKYDEIIASMGPVELEELLVKAGMPRALVDRAFLTGGIYLLPPVKREFYPKIARLHLDGSVLPTYLHSKSILIEYDDSFVQSAIAMTLANRGGPRMLEGISGGFVDLALSKAHDAGLPETDVSALLSADLGAGTIILKTGYGMGAALKEETFTFKASDLVWFPCEKSLEKASQ